MKKLFAVLAMAVMASSAFGQTTLPGAKRKIPDVIKPIRNTITIPILQVQQCEPPTLTTGKDGEPPTSVLPAGVTPTNWCFIGANSTDVEACRFVGGVLCIDPGPDGDWKPWFPQLTCPEGTSIVIQGAKLRKVEPAVPKCPDIYPGVDWIQTGNSGIRTFFALKFTPCNTEFRVILEYACVTNAFPRHVVEVHETTFVYKVVVRPDTLRFVLEALHCQPLGVCEVSCIADEGLFARLLGQADAIAAAAKSVSMGSNAALVDLNVAFDNFEATLVKYATFVDSAWTIDKDGKFHPCALFADQVPGNKTLDAFKIGIVDTFEHPCVCKLIADLVCLKNEFIGSDP